MAAHAGRSSSLPCLPHRYDAVRCYRKHAENEPAIGQPIEAKKPPTGGGRPPKLNRNNLPPSLEPKTVINTHRMLHRAWEDFVAWGWAKRNVVNDAHPPRQTRKGRKVWTVTQLQTFLQRARPDRFFALWVLEATSGMRRCELAGARLDGLDLDAGNPHHRDHARCRRRPVIESDGKTENAQRTPGARPVHPRRA